MVATRAVSQILFVCQFVLYSLILSSPGAHAQSSNNDPPVIELANVTEGRRGDAQVFSATVTDDAAVRSVTLHYRMATEAPYVSIPMNVIPGTSIYTASISSDQTDADYIQYYVEASDTDANRAVQGFAFDPLERTLIGSAPVVPDVQESPPEPEPVPMASSGNRRIIYGLLGLVVVGALLASAGGDSSDSGASGVPLTVNVDPLPLP